MSDSRAREGIDRGRALVALGQVVCRLRKRRGMSSEQLAGIIGVERQEIDALEAGRLDPCYDVLVVLADALGVRASTLIIDAEARRPARP